MKKSKEKYPEERRNYIKLTVLSINFRVPAMRSRMCGALQI
jgi:hypothetical protein